MTRYILDTSIVLHYIRKSKLSIQIEEELNMLDAEVLPLVCSVTVGELKGFVQRQKWGKEKVNIMLNLLSKLVIIDINGTDEQLTEAYATLWNYSKNALPEKPLGKSIGIGQNDVWIAAAAKVSNAKLVTTDNDFDHLHTIFIEVIKYAP